MALPNTGTEKSLRIVCIQSISFRPITKWDCPAGEPSNASGSPVPVKATLYGYITSYLSKFYIRHKYLPLKHSLPQVRAHPTGRSIKPAGDFGLLIQITRFFSSQQTVYRIHLLQRQQTALQYSAIFLHLPDRAETRDRDRLLGCASKPRPVRRVPLAWARSCFSHVVIHFCNEFLR